DAIVVGESVYAERQIRGDPLDAAIGGTRRVSVPVVFAVLTTVVAFAPLLFLPDESGKLYSNIPMIVIPILLISLGESLGILPSHLGHSKPEDGGWLRGIGRAQARFSRWFEAAIERYYRPAVEWTVRHRYVAVAGGLGLLMLTAGYVGGGFIKFQYMPKIEADQVGVTIEMPFGTSAEQTRRIADRITRTAHEVLAEQGEDLARGVYTQVGSVTRGGGPEGTRTSTGSHLASVTVALSPPEERSLSSRDFSQLWRQRVGELAGPERLDFQYAVGPGSDASFQVELRHPDRDTLRRAAAELAGVLRGYAGVYDVDDGFEEGKPQMDLTLKPAARALGVTERDLAAQVRNAFYGVEAQRDQRGRDELRIYVRRPRSERESLYHLSDFLVTTPTGGEIPLSLAAEVSQGESFTAIERENGSRAVDIAADVDIDVMAPGDLLHDVQERVIPRLMEQYPGLTWEKSGQQMRQERSFAALSTGLTVALLVMFALLAMAFQSYAQPAIILSAIPFGIVGALLGHVLLGYHLSLVSVLGIVALCGVVVNDSLVLVSAANDHLHEGKAPVPAAVEAGVRRFRPVLLTSLTTFLGLAPMILETSVQAQFLIPMAVSLGFGVLFVTFIALGLVPALFVIVEDVRRLIARR
ncbi:MAG TPA: efflux RND transporter permease subunit, partial [Polyangiaceae bacterium]|nr:efflux RND transporter permease subunit [Polyangiaceae bacterium]